MNAVPVDELIDPHIHLWDVRGTERMVQNFVRTFGWNERVLRASAKRLFPEPVRMWFGERTALLADYLPADYRADSASSNVGRYVHIQAGWKGSDPTAPVGETEWLASLDDGPAAIVGHADLELGADVGSVLRAHGAASDRFRGIRYMLSHHPNENVHAFAERADLTIDPQWLDGYEQLAEHGLSFDAWCFHGQLEEVAVLAERVPEVPVVLDHCGTPVGIAGPHQGVGVSQQERVRIADEWRAGIERLASVPHVMCKLSGLLMPALGFGFDETTAEPSVAELVDRLSPLIAHCIDMFGPERCMVASNFPVDAVSARYDTVMSAMAEIVGVHGEDAEQRMLTGTAAEFYKL
ncbi:MAG: amidohydrolase family protein [Acidimicrobiales bacterium]